MKKKLISFILTVVMIASMIPAGVLPAYAESSDFVIDENGVLTAYNGSGGDVVVPDGIVSIGEGVFANRSDLTGIELPDSVISIRDFAFAFCSNLESVAFSDSLESIGISAFVDCYGLTSIEIPDSVTSIGNHAFAGCENIESIILSKSLTTISDSSFNDNRALKTLELPEGLKIIEPHAFAGCNTLASINLPDSLETIGENAFGTCYGFTSIVIPESVKSIGYGAFNWCENLTSVTFEGQPDEIGDTAFREVGQSVDCTLTLPDSWIGEPTAKTDISWLDGYFNPTAQRFVLHDITNDLFLTGGDEWGTQLVGDKHGKFMKFDPADGGYALATGFDNGNNSQYLSEAGWCDGSFNDAVRFEFVTSENGFYIKKRDSDLYLTKGDVPSGFTKPTYSFVQTDTPTEWELLSREDIIARSDDFTPLIRDANMSRNDTGFTGWSGTYNIGKVPPTGDSGTILHNTFGEFWSEFGGGNFNMYQTVKDIPNGKYILKAQGFYRCSTFDDAVTEYANGTGDELVSYLYVSSGTVEEKIKLNSIASENFYSGGSDDQLCAVAAFTAGKYQNELEIEVTDGTLTIGVKSDGDINPGAWATFDNFELYYIPSPSHEHVFSTEWTKNETAHWHVCTADGCDIEDYATCGLEGAAYGAHVYDQEVVADRYLKSEAIYTRGGIYYMSCKCGACDKSDTAATFTDYENRSLSECFWMGVFEYGLQIGRQGKLNAENEVSAEAGRTIIPLTAEQLGEIGDCLTILANDGNGDFTLTVDCVYTYFYDVTDGTETKYEAGQGDLADFAAFIILDKKSNDSPLTGYGYFRVYNGDAVDEDYFMFDALYASPAEPIE